VIALIQRVSQARVTVDERLVGAIGPGLLVLVCAEPEDTAVTAARLVDKLVKLRLFADEAGKMNRTLQEAGGALLVVSQFTLAADVSGGNRPSFGGAAPPAQARALVGEVLAQARLRLGSVEAGEFGAHMQVQLVNDGPVTIPLRVR